MSGGRHFSLRIFIKAPFQVLQTKVLPDPRHQGSRARTGESSSVLALDAGTTQTPGTAGGKDADVLRKEMQPGGGRLTSFVTLHRLFMDITATD